MEIAPFLTRVSQAQHRLPALISIRSETRVFQKPRHPGECRDPGNSAAYWIPAFAGMTEDAVYGRTLISATPNNLKSLRLSASAVQISSAYWQISYPPY